MTTDMSDTDEAAVSKEAHERVQRENATLKSKVDELSQTVTDLGVKEIVRAHFTKKGLDGDGAEWAATIALPTIPKDTEADKLGTYLDDNFARLYPTSSTPDITDESGDGEGTSPPGVEVPTPDAQEPPGFARPSPAGDGTPPVGSDLVAFGDPEFQELLKSGYEAGLMKLIQSDRYRWHTKPLAEPGTKPT